MLGNQDFFCHVEFVPNDIFEFLNNVDILHITGIHLSQKIGHSVKFVFVTVQVAFLFKDIDLYAYIVCTYVESLNRLIYCLPTYNNLPPLEISEQPPLTLFSLTNLTSSVLCLG